MGKPLSWFGIIRLGLVQTALGAIIVLTTSTMNRVMVVELALPAMLPGALVTWHYALQTLRPRWGYGSDVGGSRTPWIIGGMAVLGLGGIGASLATAWMSTNVTAGVLLAVIAFTLIGVGVGAAGTSLLVLLAKRVAEPRRAPAATIVWIMMIAGFAVTAGVAGSLLDPFSPERLVAVTSGLAVAAFLLAVVAVWGVEGKAPPAPATAPEAKPPFRVALAEVWAEPEARRFTVFLFMSMLAYSAQDLILEPFAGAVFGMTPGESTKLSGIQHSGVLAGLIAVALAGSALCRGRLGSMRHWVVGGCLVSAAALASLVAAGVVGPGWPLRASVFVLGAANGAFAGAAIASMMGLAGRGHAAREGVRMGLWGASQALAFGLGGFVGTVAVDIVRYVVGDPVVAYTGVFATEALLFVVSAGLATQIHGLDQPVARDRVRTGEESFAAGTGRG
ncbi:BCD family MFS transporter [Blastochloris sulfoviridis]|uniref:BCD family MFS transporter n=1 Tax=Blastochloris sulfoviridis TaxID=50712 RepID=A0A5M6I602_9HYPH|nr:BCD family MFS transporter [Blastochloris sulfoviridis]